jgi:hypothetical protein
MDDTATLKRVDALLAKTVDIERAIEQSDAEFGTFRLEEDDAKLRAELLALSREALRLPRPGAESARRMTP